MTRLEPVYTDDDLVFDGNLLRQLEGKDGKILDSVQMSETVHHIETVAIHRMLDSIDDSHGIGMTEHLWQPLPT